MATLADFANSLAYGGLTFGDLFDPAWDATLSTYFVGRCQQHVEMLMAIGMSEQQAIEQVRTIWRKRIQAATQLVHETADKAMHKGPLADALGCTHIATMNDLHDYVIRDMEARNHFECEFRCITCGIDGVVLVVWLRKGFGTLRATLDTAQGRRTLFGQAVRGARWTTER